MEPHHLLIHTISLHSSALICLWVGVLLPIESRQGSQQFKTQLLSCSGWHKHVNELGATGSSTKLKLYQSQSSAFTRDGTKQNTWLVHAPSRYRVSLARSGFTTAQMKVHLLRLVAFGTNRRIHAAQRRWWGGVRGLLPAKMPLRVFKFILPLSKPTPLAFFPIANLSKLRCKTSAVGELKLECQAFESSTENWGFYSWNARGGVGWEWKRSDILAVAEAKAP